MVSMATILWSISAYIYFDWGKLETVDACRFETVSSFRCSSSQAFNTHSTENPNQFKNIDYYQLLQYLEPIKCDHLIRLHQCMDFLCIYLSMRRKSTVCYLQTNLPAVYNFDLLSKWNCLVKARCINNLSKVCVILTTHFLITGTCNAFLTPQNIVSPSRHML